MSQLWSKDFQVWDSQLEMPERVNLEIPKSSTRVTPKKNTFQVLIIYTDQKLQMSSTQKLAISIQLATNANRRPLSAAIRRANSSKLSLPPFPPRSLASRST